MEILRQMPHRNPMLLVDAVELGSDPATARAFKNITFSEPCYRSADAAQRADQLAYPVSLLVESFGQTAGVLLARRGFLVAGDTSRAVVFGEFSDIEFLGDAFPGDRLQHQIRLDFIGTRLVNLSGRTEVDGRPIATYTNLKAILVDVTDLARNP
ncbi:hypothetical protein P3W85_20615 [Cupriavidus basilensis]|uniref:Beta-hydroxyacyl-ACP dehydratase n=1 Tax=Cupriavidus basilensis TaxID=68895 RepID=A0ABT6ARS8_9BURK|nr:FabA/FabZ family ACP-dehydratase [Cupriavidus basilensis]MDF3835339.1 hypothetical protein [Cupriavidus basilensis]